MRAELKIGRGPGRGFKRQGLDAAQMMLFYCGAAWLYARYCKHNPVTILMYHSICHKDKRRWIAPRNRLPVEKFEAQVGYLARHRNVLSIEELLDIFDRRGVIPKKTVLITFDDGYRDTLEVAAPILESYGMPATVYLATAYIDRGENQWEDQLYSYFVHTTELPGGAEAHYDAIQNALISSPSDKRREILQAERARLRPTETPERSTLVWEEVRRLYSSYQNITLGVHTHEHTDLTSLDVDAALMEVRRSISRFKEELGYSPQHFSFPYCRVNHSVCARLSELGLRSAMTSTGVVDGNVRSSWDLKRLESPESLPTIRYWTSGAHPGLSTVLFGRA